MAFLALGNQNLREAMLKANSDKQVSIDLHVIKLHNFILNDCSKMQNMDVHLL